jgi:hypothetical protein
MPLRKLILLDFEAKMYRNWVSPLIKSLQSADGLIYEEKIKGRKSRDSAPLNGVQIYNRPQFAVQRNISAYVKTFKNYREPK